MVKNSISRTLGITQMELAQLLHISRSQLSLYEIGKRDLPVQAKMKLSKMLKAVHDASKNTLSLHSETINSEDYKKIIHELLLENKNKQIINEKKIQQILTKAAKNEALLYLIEFLKKEKETTQPEFITILEHKSKQFNLRNTSKIILKLKLKIEALKQEEKQLLKKLL